MKLVVHNNRLGKYKKVEKGKQYGSNKINEDSPNYIRIKQYVGIKQMEPNMLSPPQVDQAVKCYLKDLQLDCRIAQNYIYLGDALRHEKQFQKAIFCYKQSLKLDANNTETYNSLAVCFSHLEHFQEALNCLRKLLEQDSKHINAFINLGNVLADMQHYQQAIKCYKKAIQLDPDNSCPYFNIGQLLVTLKRYQEALPFYKQAYFMDKSLQNAFALGCILMLSNKYNNQAFHLFKKVLTTLPMHSSSLKNLAIFYLNTQRYEKAIHYLKKSILVEPWNYSVYINLGTAFQKAKKYQKSIKIYKRALQIYPKNHSIYNHLGVSYESMNQYSTAVSYYIPIKALQINPKYAQAYVKLGRIYYKMDRLPQSKGCFLKALQIDSSYQNAYMQLGKYFKNTKQIDRAISCFKRVIVLNSKNTAAYQYLGNAYQQIQEFERAISYLLKCIQLDSHHFIIYFKLGQFYRILQRLQEATKYHKKALQIDPFNINAHHSLAFIYYQTGQYEMSLKYLKRIFIQRVRDPQVMFKIGTILQLKKESKKALNYFSKAIQLNSSYPQFYIGMGRALVDLELYKKAISYYKKGLQLNPNLDECHVELGIIFLDLNDYDKAINCLSRGFLLTKNTIKNQLQLSIIFDLLQKNGKKINFKNKCLLLNIDSGIIKTIDRLDGKQTYFLLFCLLQNLKRDFSLFQSFWKLLLYKFDYLLLLRYFLVVDCNQMIKYLVFNIKKITDPANYQSFNLHEQMSFCLLFSPKIYASKSNDTIQSIALYMLHQRSTAQQQTFKIVRILLQKCINFNLEHKSNLNSQISLIVQFYLMDQQQRSQKYMCEVLGLSSIKTLSFSTSYLSQLMKQIQPESLRMLSKYMMFIIKNQQKMYHFGKIKQIVQFIQQLLSSMVGVKYDEERTSKDMIGIGIQFIRRSWKRITAFISTHLSQLNGDNKITLRAKNGKIKSKKSITTISPQQQTMIERFVNNKSCHENQNKAIKQEQLYFQLLQSKNKHTLLSFMKRQFQVDSLKHSRLQKFQSEDNKRILISFEECLLFNQFKKKKCFQRLLHQILIDCQKYQWKKQKGRKKTGKKGRKKKGRKRFNSAQKKTIRLPETEFNSDLSIDLPEYKNLSKNQKYYYQQCYQLVVDMRDNLEHPFEHELIEMTTVLLDKLEKNQYLFSKPLLIQGKFDSADQVHQTANNLSSFGHLATKKITEGKKKSDKVLSKIIEVKLEDSLIDNSSSSFQNSKMQESNSLKNPLSSGIKSSFSSSIDSKGVYQGQLPSKPEKYQLLIDNDSQARFYQLTYNNHAQLIRYLSKNRNKFSRIAKYYFDQSTVRKDYQSNCYISFELKLERGEKDFLLTAQNNQGYIDLLKKQGKFQMLNWINCMIGGVMELQQHHILHADLLFRNTIKVKNDKIGNQQCPFVYKLIDFDLAFKVSMSQEEYSRPVESTKALIAFWLGLEARQDKQVINYLFRDNKFINKGLYDELVGIKYQSIDEGEKMQLVMKKLQCFIMASHCYQLEDLMEDIVNFWPEFTEGRQILSLIRQVSIKDQLTNRKGFERLISQVSMMQKRITVELNKAQLLQLQIHKQIL